MDNHWVEYIVNDSITVEKHQILGKKMLSTKISKIQILRLPEYFKKYTKHLYKAFKNANRVVNG